MQAWQQRMCFCCSSVEIASLFHASVNCCSHQNHGLQIAKAQRQIFLLHVYATRREAQLFKEGWSCCNPIICPTQIPLGTCIRAGDVALCKTVQLLRWHGYRKLLGEAGISCSNGFRQCTAAPGPVSTIKLAVLCPGFLVGDAKCFTWLGKISGAFLQ